LPNSGLSVLEVAAMENVNIGDLRYTTCSKDVRFSSRNKNFHQSVVPLLLIAINATDLGALFVLGKWRLRNEKFELAVKIAVEKPPCRS
jgi:hypothetical protein